jgi:hypothetical protein
MGNVTIILVSIPSSHISFRLSDYNFVRICKARLSHKCYTSIALLILLNLITRFGVKDEARKGTYNYLIRLGGVMVRVLAIRPKVCGLKPG